MAKTLEQWRAEAPVFADLMDLRETFWQNPRQQPASAALAAASVPQPYCSPRGTPPP